MIDYKFIGWCKDGNHDKVWGVIYLEKPRGGGIWDYGGKCAVFWGRRGKKLQSQIVGNDYFLDKKIEEKIDKGYQSINKDQLREVYPEFESDLEMTAVMSMLKI